MGLFFDSNRFIIALDIIFYLLALEANLETPVIASISLNKKKIYDQTHINTWKRSSSLEKAIIEINDFGLHCESILCTKNVFIINFKKNPNFSQDNNRCAFYSHHNMLFYKITGSHDSEFYLRETLDKYKIQY
jgi:hypothetical protein